MNDIYKQLNGNQNSGISLKQQFLDFKKSISGDPQQIIQQMLNSGRISSQQLEQAKAMAQQFRGLLG
jgi:hypothetical protein